MISTAYSRLVPRLEIQVIGDCFVQVAQVEIRRGDESIQLHSIFGGSSRWTYTEEHSCVQL